MLTPDELEVLYSHVDAIKRLKRAGWVRNNVAEPESVADHSFGLAILSAKIAERVGLDSAKAALIATIHDTGESIIGDITPHDNVKKSDKYMQESDAVKTVLASDALYELWLDFEHGRTAEGRLVKQLDKLEAYLQARAYKLGADVQQEFLLSTKGVLEEEFLIELVNKLEKTDTLTA